MKVKRKGGGGAQTGAALKMAGVVKVKWRLEVTTCCFLHLEGWIIHGIPIHIWDLWLNYQFLRKSFPDTSKPKSNHTPRFAVPSKATTPIRTKDPSLFKCMLFLSSCNEKSTFFWIYLVPSLWQLERMKGIPKIYPESHQVRKASGSLVNWR